KEKLQAASRNQAQITTCSHLLVFCTDTNLEERVNEVARAMEKAGVAQRAVKTFAERIGGGFIKRMDEEGRRRWAERQTFLAFENALLGAKALGLDSCPMEGFDKEEYNRLLQLPAHLKVLAVCPVGYAADAPPVKVRLPKEQVFF
ncbi:MAG: nitroreductase family protein, partial [Candidatus Micrarchaeota archaeon]|nr:nitroreductase family protein [Candidatus Micrarchaeota archaeon]